MSKFYDKMKKHKTGFVSINNENRLDKTLAISSPSLFFREGGYPTRFPVGETDGLKTPQNLPIP